jgi:ABC-type multidrug transport system ATPase subunit
MHERFSNHTILSIVHKLESALDDFDMVVVLDAGELREFGPPRDLLQKGSAVSAFAALYESLVVKTNGNDGSNVDREVFGADEQIRTSSTTERDSTIDV